MNKSVNLLVHAGDGNSNSSKATKAAEQGIEVWTEEEWNAFVKLHNPPVNELS
jgi:NAD-dependent DNA ligase